jgi:hypothetical protein
MTNQKDNKRKLGKERRGVGAIIGGVLLTGILLTTVLLYFIIILNNDERKALYDVQSSQIDQNKEAETLTVTATQLETNPPGHTAGLYMKTRISNEGSLPLVVSHSAAYCITCASPNDPVANLISLPTALNLKDPADRYVRVSTGENWTAGFITERGNIFFSENCLIVSSTEMVCTTDSTGSTEPYFEVSASKNLLLFQPGDPSEVLTITVTSFNEYSGPVSISAVSDSPDDVTAVLTPASPTVNLLSNGFDDTTTLTITAEASATTGNYVVTVTGDDGLLQHNVHITVVVFDPTSGDPEPEEEEDALIAPQIQTIFPNPFGESTGGAQPLWGAVIANPTDHPMKVRKLVISVHDPQLSANRVLCNSNNLVGVTPSTGWACEGIGSTWNVLVWKTSGSPITIAPQDARLFLAVSGSPNTGNAQEDRPSLALNFNVYTDYGQFTKVGYDFGVKGSGNHPMVNVFLSTALANKDPSNVIGVINAQSGQDVTVRASIANYVPLTIVDNNAALIIDIPKSFTNVEVTSSTGFSDPCEPIEFFSDEGDLEGTQIRCTLLANEINGAGNSATDNVRTIEFTMTAPVVSSIKEYLLYVLGDGTTDGGTFTLGPVSENIIRVTPS